MTIIIAVPPTPPLTPPSRLPANSNISMYPIIVRPVTKSLRCLTQHQALTHPRIEAIVKITIQPQPNPSSPTVSDDTSHARIIDPIKLTAVLAQTPIPIPGTILNALPLRFRTMSISPFIPTLCRPERKKNRDIRPGSCRCRITWTSAPRRHPAAPWRLPSSRQQRCSRT